MFVFLRVAAILLLTASGALGRGLFPDAPIVRRANAWKPGRTLPRELLRFQDSTNHFQASGDSKPLGVDTISAYLSITNYRLFLEIVFAARDPRIFKLAVDQALVVGGPNRFYGDLRARWREHPERRSEPGFAPLAERARQRQVVVEEMYADDADMDRKAADAAFHLAADDLRAGMDFDKAGMKYQQAYPAPNGWQSCIAVGGQKILAEPDGGDPRGTTPPVPADLLRQLFAARAGEVFVAHDEQARQTRLYHVREAYPGGEEAGR